MAGADSGLLKATKLKRNLSIIFFYCLLSGSPSLGRSFQLVQVACCAHNTRLLVVFILAGTLLPKFIISATLLAVTTETSSRRLRPMVASKLVSKEAVHLPRERKMADLRRLL